MNVKYDMPFSMRDSYERRILMHRMYLKDSGLLRVEMFHQSKIEQCMNVKNEIKTEFLKTNGHYWSMPFACASIDFYKNHHNKSKSVFYRLSWIGPCEAQLVTHDLGATARDPSHSDRKSQGRPTC